MQSVFTALDYAPMLIDSMMDMVRVVRADGKVVIVNQAMKEQFGNGEGSVCYASLGCEHKCENCMMERLKKGESGVTCERTIKGRNFSLKSSPIYNENGQFMGSVEVFRDITDEVALRERLIRANNKLMADLSVVRGLQRNMFNKRFPSVGSLRFSMGFYPCEAVGGDACDCIPLSDGRVLLYVADVSGHGVRAAMLTVYLRQEMIMLARNTDCKDLKGMLESLRLSFSELNAGENTYITMFLAVVDTVSGEMRCVNAGHSVSPILKYHGGIAEIFIPGSPICSWSDHAGGKEGVFKLDSGDRLLLYTDGMLDVNRTNPEEQIITAFNKEPFSASAFIKEFRAHHAKNPVDDLLMFICQRKDEK